MNIKQYLTTKTLGICGSVVVVLVLLKKYFNGGVYKQTVQDLSGKYAVVTGGNSGIGA